MALAAVKAGTSGHGMVCEERREDGREMGPLADVFRQGEAYEVCPGDGPS